MKSLAIISMCYLLSATTVSATGTGGKVAITVDLQSGGTNQCTAKVTPDNSADVKITALVSKDGTAVDSSDPDAKALKFKVQVKDGAGATTLKSDGKAGQAVIHLSDGPGLPNTIDGFTGATFFVEKGTTDICGSITPSAVQQKEGSSTCDQRLAQASKQAEDYAANHPDSSTRRIGAEGWRSGGRAFIVAHKPNGETIFSKGTAPLPPDVSERDTFRLVAIVPSDASVEFNVEECDAVPWYRLLHVEAGAAAGTAQAGGPGKPPSPPPEPKEVWYDQDLRCASKLKYTVKVKLAGCETQAQAVEHTFATQPIYDFFLGAGFGFDFGSPVAYSSQNQTVDGKTQTVLVPTRDQTGFKPVITLTQFPFGLNLARQEWRCQDFPAPFIALDPTRVDKGAIAGVQWTIGKASGIMTGISVFKTQKLSSDGTTTRDTYNSDSLGFFLGANFTTDVLQQFLTAAGSALNVAGSAGAGSAASGSAKK